MKHDSPEAAGLEPSPEVVQILEKYLEELEQGGHPSPEELLSRYPHLAEPLQGCLASLDFLCRGKPSLHGQSSAVSGPSSVAKDKAASATDNGPRTTDNEQGQLGDFRILRQVGRGGMGVVYEAEQISLKRRVALKVLPLAGAMDPKLLQRFRNEAQAAAGLQHTNIVPVYDIGSERNVHYYAMQFIEGRTLAALIEELRQQKGTVVAGSPDPATPDKSPVLPSGRVSTRGVRAPDDADFVLVGPDDGAKRAEAASLADTILAPTLPMPDAGAISTGEAKATILSIKSPAFFRHAAELGRQAANGLEYAHARGVIHRDIKPSNLLIDEHNNLWIADFGLARLPSDLSLTLSGDFLGTLPYMSPEQALGEHALVDQRTDVYSLGMTLYELLTLQVAFSGGNREELLRQIAFDEPRPLRKLNAAVPRDLETIVLKAIARGPEERYATAQELADDLTRFLEDHPIRARRPTLEQRLRKLVKRHRRVVWAIGACLFVGVILSLFALGYHNAQISARNARIIRELNRETELRRRAEATAELTFDGLDKIVGDAARAFFAGEVDQKELLKNALRTYQKIAEKNDNISLRWGTAQIWIASMQRPLGENHEQVKETLQGAIDCFEKLRAASPADIEIRDQLAQAYSELGLVFGEMGKPEEGLRALDKTIKLYQELSKEYPSYCIQVASFLVNKGLLLQNVGRFQDAEAVYLYCLDYKVDLPPGCPWRAYLVFNQAAARYNLGRLMAATGRHQDAEKAFRRVIETQAQLRDQNPNFYPFPARLGSTYHELGRLLLSTGKARESEAAFRQAIAVQEKLAQEFSKTPDLRLDLSSSQHNLAVLLQSQGDVKQADGYFRRCLKLVEELTAKFPHVSLYQSNLAIYYSSRGKYFQEQKQLDEAEKFHRDAVRVYQNLINGKNTPDFRANLADCQNNLGELLEETGKNQQAESLYRQALDIFTHLPADLSLMPEFQSNLGTTYHNLARVHLANGELNSAWQFALRALGHHLTALGKNPNNPEYRRFFRHNVWVLAQLLSRQARELWLGS